jgi:cytochrome c oxidase subunit 2
MKGRIRWRPAALLAGASVLFAACASNAPQDSLDPAGRVAREIDNLFLPVFWIAAGVFFLVEGALVYFLIRYRHRKGRPEVVRQVHGNTRLEVIWTLIPAVLLAGVAVPTLGTIWDLSRRPSGDVVEITVTGRQWWWIVEYPGLDVVTANEVHIPVGRPAFISLKSDDVIHSFWVPRLAGKQDLIPGQTHTLTVEADEPGVYSGQCAEFCGLSHANMRFRVIAQSEADFQEWISAQQQDAVTPEEGLAAEGMKLFLTGKFPGGQCIACHTIRGTEQARGTLGPNLTHFASRTTFAGSIFENTPENVALWLRDPPAVKPGSIMKDYGLTEREIQALVAYLESLE